MLVAEIHHSFLNTWAVVLEYGRDHSDKLTFFEMIVLELSEKGSCSFAYHLTPTGVAVFVCESVDSIKECIVHRDADDFHILIHPCRISNSVGRPITDERADALGVLDEHVIRSRAWPRKIDSNDLLHSARLGTHDEHSVSEEHSFVDLVCHE